ncbi:uncharacterized protein C8Q71DRAFT_854306 [Rhodofomes roseus]|uniref:Uncharacterized protein n=1 Tax=Rhodofomes roseus TaxID=34475 RepID=A0ABQ8KT20_9APHY|nr:uncharacterized protein C8Q71DRAFT_854306 [Rhodofomes roseus]KAH9841960.1 hypothetical protein C8Q71DRAFT_854306 [Rhodofomes roseus]
MGFHNGVEGYSRLVFTATEAQFSLEEALETAFDHFWDPRSFRQDAEEGLAGEEMDQDMAEEDMAEGVSAGDHEVSNTAEEQEHDKAAASVKPKQTRDKLCAHAKKKAKKAKKLQQAAVVWEAVQESHVKCDVRRSWAHTKVWWQEMRGNGSSTAASTKWSRQCHVISAEAIQSTVELDCLPVTSTGYSARRNETKAGIGQHEEPTLESLIEQGFDYMEWDGMTAVPILDHEGRVIALLAGHPADATWHKVTDDLINDLKALERDFKLEKKHSEHQRGDVVAVDFGISFSGGQTEPRNLSQLSSNIPVIANFICSKAWQCFQRFGSSCMET